MTITLEAASFGVLWVLCQFQIHLERWPGGLAKCIWTAVGTWKAPVQQCALCQECGLVGKIMYDSPTFEIIAWLL